MTSLLTFEPLADRTPQFIHSISTIACTAQTGVVCSQVFPIRDACSYSHRSQSALKTNETRLW